jgi:hypothetical protein
MPIMEMISGISQDVPVVVDEYENGVVIYELLEIVVMSSLGPPFPMRCYVGEYRVFYRFLFIKFFTTVGEYTVGSL